MSELRRNYATKHESPKASVFCTIGWDCGYTKALRQLDDAPNDGLLPDDDMSLKVRSKNVPVTQDMTRKDEDRRDYLRKLKVL